VELSLKETPNNPHLNHLNISVFCYINLVKDLAFISCLLINISCFGQKASCEVYDDGSDRYYATERLSVSASPLALLDVYNGACYKAGFSFRPMNFLRVSADFGGYWPQLTEKIALWKGMKGFNFRTSAGLFLGSFTDLHLGLEYQYKTQDFNYNDSIPNMPAFNGQVNKYVHVFNVYGSYDLFLSNRFYIEFRGGLGIRYRDIYNTHSDVLGESVFWWDSMNQGRITTQKSIMPNLNFAIRLNYTFWMD